MGEITEAFRRVREQESARTARRGSADDSNRSPEPTREDADAKPAREEEGAGLAPSSQPPAVTKEFSSPLVIGRVREFRQEPTAEPSPPAPTPNAVARLAPTGQAVGVTLVDPAGPAATAIRQLAQQVRHQIKRRALTSIVVTSPLSGDGKTTTSCNMAIALSQLDRSRAVALVELDLRRPTLARALGLKVETGIDDLLAERATLDEAMIETDVPGLSVLAVRRATTKPEHLLASEKLRRLLELLRRRFWVAIIDTPPALSVSDAASVLDVADAGMLVVRAGQSPASSVSKALEHLPTDKMLGCALNFARSAKTSSDYYSYSPVDAIDLDAVEPETAAPSARIASGAKRHE